MKKIVLAWLCLGFMSALYAEEHEHAFAPDIAAFHDVMAPLWHASASAKRQADTCAAIPNMKAMAQKMPYASAKKLVEALVDLQKFCSADEKTFSASFHQVHELFHRVEKESK